ncbi:MAG: hypothetical protein K8S54_20090 [Spirochaetia bacterium]|nr:hypothetical protein [Spirochaetia bacterium]
MNADFTGIRIVSTGVCFPKGKIQNHQLPTEAHVPDGAMQRFHASREETAVWMGSTAAKQALAEAARTSIEHSHSSATGVDGIISFSGMPDFEYPKDVVLIQKELGLTKVPCWSIDTACASFLTSLQFAEALVRTGRHKRLLIVTTMNWSSRGMPLSGSAVGDGAAAAVVESSPENSLLATVEKTHSEYFDFIRLGSPFVDKPVPFEFSNDAAIGRFFATKSTEPATEALQKAQIDPLKIDHFIAHQTGKKMLQIWAKRIGIPQEKILDTFELFGNMSAVNIPATLHHFTMIHPRIKRGDTLLLFAPGAGLHLAATVWKF